MKESSLLWICVLLCQAVSVIGNEEKSLIHCLSSSNKPLLLPDPFPQSEQDDDFVSLTWFFRTVDAAGNEQREQKLMEVIFGGSKTVEEQRWEIYQHWGLKLKDPTLNDSGNYRAAMVKTSLGTDEVFHINVLVAEAPVLKSENLAVSRRTNGQTGEVTLNCGTLSSRGTPAVKLVWQASDGSVINGTFEKGNISLVLSKEEAEGTFTCELMEPAPASTCIPSSDLPRWEGTYKFDRHIASSESNIIMIVVIVCAVVLLIIAIVVIVVVVRSKMSKGAVYNTHNIEAQPDTIEN